MEEIYQDYTGETILVAGVIFIKPVSSQYIIQAGSVHDINHEFLQAVDISLS